MFSPDGSRLLGADESGALKIWDFATGREVAATTLTSRLYINSDPVQPGRERRGRRGESSLGLMTGEVRILDAETAREVWSLRGHTSQRDGRGFQPRRAAPGHRERGPDGPVLGPRHGAGDPEAERRPDVSPPFGSSRAADRLIGGSMDRTIRVWDATPLPE